MSHSERFRLPQLRPDEAKQVNKIRNSNAGTAGHSARRRARACTRPRAPRPRSLGPASPQPHPPFASHKSTGFTSGLCEGCFPAPNTLLNDSLVRAFSLFSFQLECHLLRGDVSLIPQPHRAPPPLALRHSCCLSLPSRHLSAPSSVICQLAVYYPASPGDPQGSAVSPCPALSFKGPVQCLGHSRRSTAIWKTVSE